MRLRSLQARWTVGEARETCEGGKEHPKWLHPDVHLHQVPGRHTRDLLVKYGFKV